jgi:hypothetical protein
MPWIKLPGDESTPELSRLTKRYRDQKRPTPGIMGIMKVNPKTMRAVGQVNYAVTFGGSNLGRMREELIAASVSAWNDCFY